MAQIDPTVLLAEVLRLQRWAGGESVSAAKIYGLLNGFESVIEEEAESFGVSRETQDDVENILEEIELGDQSVQGIDLKSRMRADGVSETDFGRVVELCRLQSRFLEAIDLISKSGNMLALEEKSPEQEWFGSLHYLELHLSSGGIGKRYSVFSATVPKVGEYISAVDEDSRPIRARVTEVEHVLNNDKNHDGNYILIPHVSAIDDEK